ncbi:hypothetical protein D3C76_1719880 [compost metagenome]
MAINRSSNMIMPIIISVSGLAVRFKSTSTLATIAVEELVIMPQTTSISFSGSPIIQLSSSPDTKFSAT